ncbi:MULTISPECIES: 30S ribosomal protein S20 [unclassified Thermotoga]|uniref:30S ribosomal protein S20 n=1 Tax=unclassified Thermotoga TaxID=2631113 RepID=UPI000280E9C1|nr:MULTISPECIES: 30S ribosomal protein S20 [unclassified Thermotoga]AIY86705.1 30S ribosomal protein S20 [Thermotoga sp. 2812B]EJX25423.1 30S ribosomal protein S20 [Thermotoga sp. EMP]
MPNTKSAKKRVRVSEKRRLRNKAYKTFFKNRIKEVLKAIENKEPKEVVLELTKKAQAAIDKAVSKGVIHKNQGARRKARLLKKVNEYLRALETAQE